MFTSRKALAPNAAQRAAHRGLPGDSFHSKGPDSARETEKRRADSTPDVCNRLPRTHAAYSLYSFGRVRKRACRGGSARPVPRIVDFSFSNQKREKALELPPHPSGVLTSGRVV